MAGWLHGVCVGECLFVFPLCGFSLSLFFNYPVRLCANSKPAMNYVDVSKFTSDGVQAANNAALNLPIPHVSSSDKVTFTVWQTLSDCLLSQQVRRGRPLSPPMDMKEFSNLDVSVAQSVLHLCLCLPVKACIKFWCSGDVRAWAMAALLHELL